jgi:hypothetical protein
MLEAMLKVLPEGATGSSRSTARHLRELGEGVGVIVARVGLRGALMAGRLKRMSGPLRPYRYRYDRGGSGSTFV